MASSSSTLLVAIDSLWRLRLIATRIFERHDRISRCHADIDALAWTLIVIEDVIAVETLARASPNLVIPGSAAARAAFEVAVTCAWMLEPKDMSERDVRWEAMFYDERGFWTKAAADAKKFGATTSATEMINTELSQIEEIINQVKPQVAAMGSQPIEGLPRFDQRLSQLGLAAHYGAYKASCQLVHPTTGALSLVRDLWSTHSDGTPRASYRFRTNPADWTTALVLSAEALRLTVDTVESRLLPARSWTTTEIPQALADFVQHLGSLNAREE